MKAILLIDYKIDENLTILKGAILDVIDNSSSFYVCKTYEGRYLTIISDYLKIIDYSPYIDWEQRRYELSKIILQGLVTSLAIPRIPGDVTQYITDTSIELADRFVEKLKNDKIN